MSCTSILDFGPGLILGITFGVSDFLVLVYNSWVCLQSFHCFGNIIQAVLLVHEIRHSVTNNVIAIKLHEIVAIIKALVDVR
jgi:hypothetical protein